MKPYFVPNIDDLILFTNLHGHWEVDTNRFLDKRRIRRSMANFNDIQPGKISMSHPWSCHYWKKTYLCATCCVHSKWRRKKVSFWWLSWVISTNATCPSICWLTPWSLLYSCMAPFTLNAAGFVIFPEIPMSMGHFLSRMTQLCCGCPGPFVNVL